jgi:uncharacterized membrane-anchored protein
MNDVTKQALSKVPAVTLGFWVIKILATTLSETGGDTVTMTLNWGYLAAPVHQDAAHRWRWVLSGGPARLVVVVGVAVSQNYGPVVVWCSAAFQAWPVVCPQRSVPRKREVPPVACGVLPAVA